VVQNLPLCETDLIQSDGQTCGECLKLRIARLRFHWLSFLATAMSRGSYQSTFPNRAEVLV
jgi:hypothetical protein